VTTTTAPGFGRPNGSWTMSDIAPVVPDTSSSGIGGAARRIRSHSSSYAVAVATGGDCGRAGGAACVQPTVAMTTSAQGIRIPVGRGPRAGVRRRG
jgi:hypothetical protein